MGLAEESGRLILGDVESRAKEAILTEERVPAPDEELASVIVENPLPLLEAKIRLWLRGENTVKLS